MIVSSPSFEIAAVAPDWYGPLGAVDTGLTEDRYIAWIEVREVTESREDTGETENERTVGGQAIFHHLAWQPVHPDMDRSAGATQRWPVHEVGRNPDVFDPGGRQAVASGFTNHVCQCSRACQRQAHEGSWGNRLRVPSQGV